MKDERTFLASELLPSLNFPIIFNYAGLWPTYVPYVPFSQPSPASSGLVPLQRVTSAVSMLRGTNAVVYMQGKLCKYYMCRTDSRSVCLVCMCCRRVRLLGRASGKRQGREEVKAFVRWGRLTAPRSRRRSGQIEPTGRQPWDTPAGR